MLESVCGLLSGQPGIREVLDAVRRRRPLAVEGPSGSFLAALLALVQVEARRPLAVVVPAEADLEALLLDLRSFHGAAGGEGRVVAFPALGADPYAGVLPHREVARERIHTLDRCAQGRAAVVMGTVRSWMERLQPPRRFLELSLHLAPGAAIGREELVGRLEEGGYRRTSLVENLGEFAVRGGIVDVFPPNREHPVRVELLGDAVDSLREFNPRDQRSVRRIEEAVLPPARQLGWAGPAGTVGAPPRAGEATSDLDWKISEDRASTLAGYLADPLWVEVEPEALEAEAAAWAELLDDHYHRALAAGHDAPLPEELYAGLAAALHREEPSRLVLRELAGPSRGPAAVRVAAQAAPSYRGRLAELAGELKRALARAERVCFALSRPGKARRLAEILEGYGVPVALATEEGPGRRRSAGPEAGPEATGLWPGTCWVTRGDLSRGFRLPELGLWLGTDAEVFGRVRLRARSRRFHGDAFRADFRDLAPGDPVVHAEHGIGRFAGLKTLSVDGVTQEFMEIAYLNDDRLYVPLDQLHLVQPYRAPEGARPKLDRLGGGSWRRVKGRVKRSLREMAGELLELYAARKAIEGHAFGADTPWQREMEDAFEYEETPDQDAAIAEVKADMESPRPMDRLLCGDVGYGKTEVAMRAAFKAVMDGKQVALLTPTTVLAHQHWRTFRERLAAFPIRVELLSRFRTAAEQRRVLEDLVAGGVDIVIGTHRLLSGDVRFRDLGLLVIDEEQRFGVAAKERLKQLRRQVDVLSMTATPIPRTLQMSLVGIRDLSVIETPPKDRYAVATHVVPYDPEVIAAAIREELARGGQVYFVHNRVASIGTVARRLQELVPEARYRVAHGKLPERQLERAMLDFVEHRADVLVTTTIIENGLDIPLANTMIVHRADRFGLAQLYQLRGRIGRSDRRAVAYLLIPPPETLSTAARKRLRAIQEFAELGSGFRLAAMDLEIRGAGTLLGERQHGHLEAVGFDMYIRLLEEAVRELQGQPIPEPVRAQLNLGVSLQIPGDYVEDPLQRLMVARRLASARDPGQLETLKEELRDRYGPLPPAVEELFVYAELRLLAEELGIAAVDRVGRRLEIRFGPNPRIDADKLLARLDSGDGWRMRPPDRLIVEPGPTAPPALAAVQEVLDSLR